MRGERSSGGGVKRLVQSNRARIPLALVGVLALLAAALLVGQAAIDDDPTADVDPSVAVETTEAATQTAVREGVRDATERVAAQPLTNTTDENPYAERIHAAPDPFRAYLKAVIYHEVQDRLAGAGQTVGDVDTRVTVPDIESPADFERALERVDLEKDPDDSEAVLGVTIDGVTVTAEHRNETIHSENTSIEVAVATPILDLHEKVGEYERLLNAGITESGSFSQRFNARMYGIGYLRGWAQNYQLPVVEVIANRHVEPSANSAAYRVQQDVFGSADPALKGAVQAGWACMLAQDGEAFMGESEYSMGADFTDSIDVDADQLCNVTDLLLDPEADLGLDGTDIVQETLPGMDHEQEIEVGNTASIPLSTMADPRNEHSIHGVLERLFEVNLSMRTDRAVRSDLSFDHDCAAHGDSLERTEIGPTQLSSTTADRIDQRNATIYAFSMTVRADVREECDESDLRDGINPRAGETADTDTLRVSLETELTIEEANPNALIDRETSYDTDREFVTSPDRSSGAIDEHDARDTLVPDGFQNYGGPVKDDLAMTMLSREVFGLSEGPVTGTWPPACLQNASLGAAYRCWVTKQLEKDGQRGQSNDHVNGPTYGITSPGDLTLANRSAVVSVDPTPYVDNLPAITSTMYDDLQSIRSVVADLNHTFERGELLETGEESPIKAVLEEIRTMQAEKTDLGYLGGGDEYVDTGEKFALEVRYTYFELLEEQLAVVGEMHAEAMDSLEDQIDEALPSGMDGMAFFDRGTDDPEPSDTEIPSPAITDPVTYEVSGSPTYLEPRNLTTEDVPAINEDVDQFTPLAMRNQNFADLPYDEVTSMLGELMDLVPLLGSDPDAELSYRMAADVLLAAELTEQAYNAEEYIDESTDPTQPSFEDDVTTLRGTVEDSIEDFEAKAANQTTMQLYDQDVAKCAIHSPDGFLDHMSELDPKMYAATLSAVSTVTDPSELLDRGVSAIKDGLEAMAGEIGGAVADRLGFSDSDEETVEDKAEELGEAFEEAETVEEAPFDPRDAEYDYGDCARTLHSTDAVDGDRTETILHTRDELEAAIAAEVEAYRETHGVARTAEAIGTGNLTDPVLERVLDRLDDPATHLPSDWQEQYGGVPGDDEWNTMLEAAITPGLERGANLNVEVGDTDMVERIDERIQTALDNVSTEITEARGEDLPKSVDHLGEDTLATMEEWVGTEIDAIGDELTNRHTRAARVPAGLPLVPVPGFWYATINAWDVEVAGEYARFELTGNIGGATDTTSLTYVREDRSVELDLAGESRRIGQADSLAFDGQSIVIVVVPPGVGVGDRDDTNPECSPTFPETGAVGEEAIECNLESPVPLIRPMPGPG